MSDPKNQNAAAQADAHSSAPHATDPDAAEREQGRRGPKRGSRLRALGGVALALVLAAVAALVFRAPLAGWVAERVLALRGVEAEVQVAELGLTRARLDGLRIGPAAAPGFEVQALTARYEWRAALGGVFDAIEVDGVSARFILDANGVRLAGWPEPRPSAHVRARPERDSGGFTPPALTIDNAQIFLATPAGEIVADVAASGGPADGWRLALEAFPAVLSQADQVLTLETGVAEVTIGADGVATGKARLVLGDTGQPDARALSSDVTLSFDGGFPDGAVWTALAGAGEVRARLSGVSAPGLAQAVGSALADPQTETTDPLGPHREALRALIQEALALSEVELDAGFVVERGRVSLALEPGVRARSASGVSVRVAGASRQAVGVITFDPSSPLADPSATGLSVRLSGPSDLKARATVASARRTATGWTLSGSGALEPWRVEGAAIGARIDAFDTIVGPAPRVTSAGRGVVALDGTLKGARVLRAEELAVAFNLIAEQGADGLILRAGIAPEPGPEPEPGQSSEPSGQPGPAAGAHLTAGLIDLDGLTVSEVTVRLQPAGDAPFLVMGPEGSDVRLMAEAIGVGGETDTGAWRLEAPLVEVSANLNTQSASQISLRAQAPAIGLELAERGRGDLRAGVIAGAATLDAGRLDFSANMEGFTAAGEAIPVSVRGGAADLSLAVTDGALSSGRLTLSSAEMRDTQALARFAPMQARGDSTLANGVVTGEMSVDLAAAGARLLDVTFQHDMATGTGGADVATRPISFAPAGLQPSDLAPILRGYVADVSGELGVSGRLGWRPDGVQFPARLSLDALRFSTDVGLLNGLSSEIAFSDLLTLTSDGPQSLAIDLFDPGVALSKIAASFDLPGQGAVTVVSATAPFADGVLQVRDAAWAPGMAEPTAVVEVQNIDLTRVIELVRPPDLVVTGRVSGLAPIVISGRSVLIRDALLTATQEGRIAYTGAAGEAASRADERAGDAFAALRNFEFRTLSLAVSGPLDGEMRMTLEAEGVNPDRDRTQPIEFTLNTTGDLARLITRSAQSLDLGATLREAREQERR